MWTYYPEIVSQPVGHLIGFPFTERNTLNKKISELVPVSGEVSISQAIPSAGFECEENIEYFIKEYQVAEDKSKDSNGNLMHPTIFIQSAGNAVVKSVYTEGYRESADAILGCYLKENGLVL